MHLLVLQRKSQATRIKSRSQFSQIHGNKHKSPGTPLRKATGKWVKAGVAAVPKSSPRQGCDIPFKQRLPSVRGAGNKRWLLTEPATGQKVPKKDKGIAKHPSYSRGLPVAQRLQTISHKYSRIQSSIAQKREVFQLACCRQRQSPAPTDGTEREPPAPPQPPGTSAPGPFRSCLKPDDTESGCSQPKMSAGLPG